MDEQELKKLKSGTDIRGVAIGDSSPVTLTDEAVEVLSKAFAVWAKRSLQKDSLTVAVGYDSRLSSPHIESIVSEALLSCGCDVAECGLSSTPSMFMLLKNANFADVSIEITASHLPYDRNGLKFFTPEGGLEAEDIDEIIEIASHGSFPEGDGKRTSRPYMDEYSKALRERIEDECGKKALCGMKIVVDAGNGVGRFFVEDVLKPLGADVSASLYLNPDGRFPNHIPNPENEAAIDGLAKAVLDNKADLGIIFDTDCDRSAFVDEKGEKINRNNLIALLSAILLEERPGTIVTDSVASTHVTEFIESLGGKHLRYKRGYKNVIDKCKELNDSGTYSPLAVETSGHAAFAENYFLDDGAYMAVKMLCCKRRLAENGQTFSDLIADLKRPAEEDEVRIDFQEGMDFRYEGAAIIESLKKSGLQDAAVDKENWDGVRFLFEDGWALIRSSVHDPVMPINFESDTPGGDKRMAKKLLSALRPFESLDLEKLERFAGK